MKKTTLIILALIGLLIWRECLYASRRASLIADTIQETSDDLLVACEARIDEIVDACEAGKIDEPEQAFFDLLDEKLNTDTEKNIAHIFYGDDDSLDDVAQGILDDLEHETLLQSVSFNPDGDTTVCVMIVKK